jgi:hypothetical protein
MEALCSSKRPIRHIPQDSTINNGFCFVISLTGPNRLNIRNDDSDDNDDNDDDDDDDDDRRIRFTIQKSTPKTITFFAAEIKSEIVSPGVKVSPNFLRDALVARLLMPPVGAEAL